MSNQSTRTYSRIATSIVISALVLAGGIIAATYVSTSSTATRTTTIIETTTTIQTITLTGISTNSPTSTAISTTQSYQPCLVNGRVPLGVSEITVNGTTTCVVGPSIIVDDDGRIDFRNGTVVDLHTNLTASNFIGGSTFDTVVTSNATRFIFNAHGVIATIFPYQGKEVFTNGTIATFPTCAYPISTNLQLPRNASGNGTVWFTSTSGGIVRFYPDGTCSAASG